MEHPFNDELKAVLDSCEAYSLLPEGTWMAGGCGLLASALRRVIGAGSLVTVGRQTPTGVHDHVVMRLDFDKVSVFVDYDGVQNAEELVVKMESELSEGPIMFGTPNYGELESWGVIHEGQPVCQLARLLTSKLGLVDVERLSPDWA